LKRHGHLFEKIISFDNLVLAAKKAFRGKKDKRRIADFCLNLENEILALRSELHTRTYAPRPLRAFWIYEPKLRKIGASDLRDRVVHHAVFNIIEPILERGYISHSYACRTGKGTHRVVRQAQAYCRRYRYFLKCDVRKYFESIDHEVLKRLLERRFKDPELLWLLGVIIEASGEGGRGIPIGSLSSQHFANLYLDCLDHHVKDGLGVKGYIRYMDDFLCFGNDKEGLHRIKADIESRLRGGLKLELKRSATMMALCRDGVPFLGFNIFPGIIRMRRENKKRSLGKMRARTNEFETGQLGGEAYSRSMSSIAEHLKMANTYRLRRDVLDKAP